MFATKQFWNRFFRQQSDSDCCFFDIYVDWSEIQSLVATHFAAVDGADALLHIGNGSSAVPMQLAIDLPRFVFQIAIDISLAVQAQMAAAAPQIAWVVGDATAMPFADASIGAAFDKGTLDSLIYEPDMARAYCAELFRVLKPGAPCLVVACNVLDGDPSSCDVFLRAHGWSTFEQSLVAPADKATGRTTRWAFRLVKPTAA
jgi:ubiquinone/menaquinone biosynthesis C-methylase UbiE